ncbi:hypothetical protein ACERZ8_20580 [Tateyamaria armeniaca]|uniref:Uncharacterized protein n=1 Tax=Tateyamaria armeniaca TaxID=2518930 RepID=A0ABW8UZB7_9RHOB
MTEMTPNNRSTGHRIAMGLSLILVVVGMINTLPEIEGLQNWAREVTGIPLLRISGFATEYFFPPSFS